MPKAAPIQYQRFENMFSGVLQYLMLLMGTRMMVFRCGETAGDQVRIFGLVGQRGDSRVMFPLQGHQPLESLLSM